MTKSKNGHKHENFEDNTSVAESENTSRTLGDEDTTRTPSVRQNVEENSSSAPSVAAGTAIKRKGPVNPWDNKRSVANLFADNRKPANGLKLQQVELDEGPIKLDEGDVSETEWNYCLVGYFGGKFPGKNALQQLVTSWKDKVSTHFHSSGWIIFEFDSLDARDRTLQEGPYMVFGRPLLLKILPDYFTFNYEELSCFPIWVQLRNLPLKFWNSNALSKICTRIGKPVYTDKLTARKGRINFARVLVEVDVAKPVSHMLELTLPNGGTVYQSVFYETLPLFCTHCKTVSHSTSGCKVLEKFAAANRETESFVYHLLTSSNIA